MSLIDTSYDVDEFEFMRSHYQKALFNLLKAAKTSNHLAKVNCEGGHDHCRSKVPW